MYVENKGKCRLWLKEECGRNLESLWQGSPAPTVNETWQIVMQMSDVRSSNYIILSFNIQIKCPTSVAS